jgi:hypothetical protein
MTRSGLIDRWWQKTGEKGDKIAIEKGNREKPEKFLRFVTDAALGNILFSGT